ncbi:UvrD-helicase domain-containing protein [Fibrobacterota bacterium]
MNNIQIIGAGAGSGKTFRLAEEVFNHIHREKVPPDRILLTTFTNMAAEELRSRVTARLIKAGKFKEAQEIRQARMGTVNSVCGSIIGDFALEAGLPPEQKVIDEGEAKSLFNAAMSTALTGSRLEELDRLAGVLGVRNYHKKEDWTNDVLQISQEARTNRIAPDDLSGWARKSAEINLGSREPAVKSDRKGMLREAERARRDITGLYAEGEQVPKTVSGAVDMLEKFISGTKSGRLAWAQFRGLSDIYAGARGKAGDADTMLEKFRNLACGFRRWEEFRKDIEDYILRVYQLAAETLKNYDRMKKEAGLIDFTDQEVLCLELLENPDVAKKIGEQLELVLIDEFQDTSPIQLALFLKFADLSARSIWVGDPKQSIYIFRGAEPGLMLEAYKKIRKKDPASRLGENWRSRWELVKFTNGCFKELFKTQGMDPGDVRLDPVRKEKELPAPALESWVLGGKNNGQRLSAAAARIRDMFERPDEYPVVEKGSKKIRPLEYRDVGVLLRSNDECAEFAGLLRDFGVPAELSTAGLLELPESKVCLAALRLFLNPGDRWAAASLTWHREVMTAKSKDTRWLDARIKEVKANAAKAWASDTCLQSIRGQAHAASLPVSTAFSLAVELSGIKEIILKSVTPRAALANLEQLEGLALKYQESGSGPGLAGFLDFLADTAGRKEDSMAAGSGSAVTVSTWHKAKGLEWPMVILGSLDKKPIRRLGIQVMPAEKLDIKDPLAGRGVIYLVNPYNSGTIKDQWVQDTFELPEYRHKQKARQEENLRLLYVALTRARDYMIFAAAPGKLQSLAVETPAGPVQVCEVPQDVTDIPDQWRIRALDPAVTLSEVEGSTGDSAAGKPDDNMWFPYADKPSEYRAGECAPSAFGHADTSRAGVSVAKVLDISGPVTVTGNPDNNVLGDAVHGYMAVNTSEMDDAGRVKIAVRILTAMKIQNSLKPADLVKQGNALSDYISKTWGHAGRHRELSLSVEINQVTINGYADLLLDTGDGLVIIDHKTMTGREDWLKSKALEFAPQLAAYSEAASRAMNKPVHKAYIYYVIEGKLVEVEMKDTEKVLVEAMK